MRRCSRRTLLGTIAAGVGGTIAASVRFSSALAQGTTDKSPIERFDDTQPGVLPREWIAGVTGRGSPRWSVTADPTAPSAPHVLEQSGHGDYPWCVKRDVTLADGFVEVRLKPIRGAEDRAGGLVWRFKDTNNYYVARANALENNVALYYTVGGRRSTIRYVDAPVATNVWHSLRVEFASETIRVTFNGVRLISLRDRRIAGPGAVGVWTKADSVAAFDDFAYEPA